MRKDQYKDYVRALYASLGGTNPDQNPVLSGLFGAADNLEINKAESNGLNAQERYEANVEKLFEKLARGQVGSFMDPASRYNHNYVPTNDFNTVKGFTISPKERDQIIKLMKEKCDCE